MTLKADEVYAAGLALDADERTVVAHRLLGSLHDDTNDAGGHDDQTAVDAAWRDEIDRRLAGVMDGTAVLLDGPASHEAIRAELAARRA